MTARQANLKILLLVTFEELKIKIVGNKPLDFTFGLLLFYIPSDKFLNSKNEFIGVSNLNIVKIKMDLKAKNELYALSDDMLAVRIHLTCHVINHVACQVFGC